ncbi:MAG TPA: hypothetical protein VHS96_17560 [Bacteroidia bacterium]|jgi:hypothetical protein|nr:hypothetical protein [Bacteroidia bacterium]
MQNTYSKMQWETEEALAAHRAHFRRWYRPISLAEMQASERFHSNRFVQFLRHFRLLS